MHASSLPGLRLQTQFLGLLPRFSNPRGQPLFKPARKLGVRFARRRQNRQLVAGLGQNRLDDAVHQQIRVTPDRTGEMGVGIKGQSEVATVNGRVDGLLHGTQQHGMNLLRIRPVLGSSGNGLKLAGRGIVTDRQPQARDFEVVAQNLFFLGRGALMDPKQAGMLALGNEVRAAHIGRQHGLFNQLVGVIAGARHDLLDTPALITNDLRFNGLEVHCTAAHA